MELYIDYKQLAEQIRNADEFQVSVDAEKSQYEVTPGMEYLLNHVIRPVLLGARLHTGDLELGAFHRDDVQDAITYFYEVEYSSVPERHRQILTPFYHKLKRAAPTVGTVGFV